MIFLCMFLVIDEGFIDMLFSVGGKLKSRFDDPLS